MKHEVIDVNDWIFSLTVVICGVLILLALRNGMLGWLVLLMKGILQ